MILCINTIIIWLITKGYSTEQAVLEITENLTQQLMTKKLPVANFSISQKHLIQLTTIFC